MKALDITGNKYNKLTAIKFSHKEGKQKKAKWLFKCDCGEEKVIGKARVIGSYTKSCGCLMRAEQDRFIRNSTTHGLSGGRKKRSEYNTWQSIKGRCLRSTEPGYHNYGGRGIKICDRWINSFPNFLEDMGEKPSKDHSIDRIDNNGDYEPTNCRWATRIEQARNTRLIRLITIDGITRCLSEWVELSGLKKSDIYRDLYQNKLSIEEALGMKK